MLELPESPWTYENGNLNPNLHPPGASALTTRRRSRGATNKPTISSVPPYHPDYKSPSDHESFSDEETVPSRRTGRLVRRGSEGYEVRTIDREAMLRQHVTEQMQEPGRYNIYMPDPPSESDDDEDTLISTRVERWRAEAAIA